MNIQINNNYWIEVEEEDHSIITAYGSNGNIIQICDIRRKYLKQLYKDIGKLLNSPSNVGHNKLNGGASNGVRKDTGRSQKKSCNKKATPKLRSYKVEE